MAKNLYIGIDPGKTGAITFLDDDGKVVLCAPSPQIGTSWDRFGMVKLIKDFWLDTEYEIIHAVLEDIHATHMAGNTGSFTMGQGLGIWQGILPSLEIPHSLITPSEWQKRIWVNTNKQYKPSSTGKTKVVDTKATSLLTVKNLFPNQNLLASTRSRVPHDGMVDSLLIAKYCFLMNKGKLDS